MSSVTASPPGTESSPGPESARELVATIFALSAALKESPSPWDDGERTVMQMTIDALMTRYETMCNKETYAHRYAALTRITDAVNLRISPWPEVQQLGVFLYRGTYARRIRMNALSASDETTYRRSDEPTSTGPDVPNVLKLAEPETGAAYVYNVHGGDNGDDDYDEYDEHDSNSTDDAAAAQMSPPRLNHLNHWSYNSSDSAGSESAGSEADEQ